MKSLARIITDIRALDTTGPKFDREFCEHVEMAMSAYHEDAIAPLLTCLVDVPDLDSAMFSLVHAVERANDHVYVEQLLLAVTELQARAPRWATIVLIRVLNSEGCFRELSSQLLACSAETRKSICKVMDLINDRTPKLSAKTKEIVAIAKAK